MPELTLESLAARLAAVEKQLADQKPTPPKNDWRRSVGLFDDDPDFAKEVVAEITAIREAERAAIEAGEP